MKWIKRGAVALLILVAIIAGYIYHQLDSLEQTSVTDDVVMLEGLGGNVVVLRTDIGAVVVDSMTFSYAGRPHPRGRPALCRRAGRDKKPLGS